MKNSKNKTNFLSLFFLLFTLCHLSAQPLFKITANNSNAAANSIVQNFPSHVQISNGQINSLFNTILTNQPINPNIGLIKAQVFELQVPAIHFGWSPVNAQATYHVDYINLRTGQVTNYSTNDLGASFNIFSRDLHLFAFYTDSPLGRSHPNIMLADLNLNIIIDKDIFSPNESIPSGCINPTPIPITTNSTFVYSKSFEWPSLCTNSKYYVHIERSDANGSSSGSYKMIYEHAPSDLIPPKIRIEPLGPWTPEYFFGKKGDFEILLTSNQFTVFFPDHTDATITSVSASKCACGVVPVPKSILASSISPGTIKLRAFPNPTSSTVSIEYQLAQSDDVSIYVADALLQNKVSIQQGFYQNNGTHIIDVDMQDFAPGIYHCIIQTATERKSIKLVKLE